MFYRRFVLNYVFKLLLERIFILMEEYQNRMNYMRHLKKIADIRQLNRKGDPLAAIFNRSFARSKDITASSKCTSRHQKMDHRVHTSSERLMRDFTVEKENTRLLSKIMTMNTTIPLKRYEQQYQHAKQILHGKEYRIKRNQKYFYFKIYDINMNQDKASSPDDEFKIYVMQNRCKAIVANENLYGIKKIQFKLKKGLETVLRIQGQDHSGTVKFDQSNLMEIMRHGHKIGHIVVEYLKK